MTAKHIIRACLTTVTVILTMAIQPGNTEANSDHIDAEFLAEISEFTRPPDELDTNLDPDAQPDISAHIETSSTQPGISTPAEGSIAPSEMIALPENLMAPLPDNRMVPLPDNLMVPLPENLSDLHQSPDDDRAGDSIQLLGVEAEIDNDSLDPDAP